MKDTTKMIIEIRKLCGENIEATDEELALRTTWRFLYDEEYLGGYQGMRRKIISLFRRMGYEKKGKADMTFINYWAKRYGPSHKEFNQYTLQEMPSLVYEAELVFERFLELRSGKTDN